MKKLTWAFSGLLLLVGLPILFVLEAMVFGGAHVGPGDLTPVTGSMVAIPLVWLGALIACIVEGKRRQREKLMWFYRLSPFAAVGVHLVVTVLTSASIHSRPQRARDEAIAKYTAAIQQTPTVAENYVGRGKVLSQWGDYDRAIADFTEAIRLDPAHSAAYYGRGFAFSGKADAMRALADYDEAIRTNPNNVDAHRQRGFHYRDQKMFDQAIADFSAIIRAEPGNVDAYMDLAFCHKSKGDFAAAIVDYTELIRRSQDNEHPFYFSRADAYLQKGDVDAAIADYTEFIRISAPPSMASFHLAKAYGDRGAAYVRKRDYDHAIADFSAALDEKPQPIPAASDLAQRGYAYASKGNTAAAIADYTEAARLNPSDADAGSLLAWHLATARDEKLRDGPKAVGYAQKACEISEWKSPWHLDRLAVAHAASGNFEEAVKWEQKALELPGSENEKAPRRARLDLFRQGKPVLTR